MASSTHTKPLAIGDAAPRLWVAVSRARGVVGPRTQHPRASHSAATPNTVSIRARRARECARRDLSRKGALRAPHPPFTF
jgi:hypothetical protein